MSDLAAMWGPWRCPASDFDFDGTYPSWVPPSPQRNPNHRPEILTAAKSEISVHIYSNSYTLLNSRTKEWFTFTELLRSTCIYTDTYKIHTYIYMYIYVHATTTITTDVRIYVYIYPYTWYICKYKSVMSHITNAQGNIDDYYHRCIHIYI